VIPLTISNVLQHSKIILPGMGACK